MAFDPAPDRGKRKAVAILGGIQNGVNAFMNVRRAQAQQAMQQQLLDLRKQQLQLQWAKEQSDTVGDLNKVMSAVSAASHGLVPDREVHKMVSNAIENAQTPVQQQALRTGLAQIGAAKRGISLMGGSSPQFQQPDPAQMAQDAGVAPAPGQTPPISLTRGEARMATSLINGNNQANIWAGRNDAALTGKQIEVAYKQGRDELVAQLKREGYLKDKDIAKLKADTSRYGADQRLTGQEYTADQRLKGAQVRGNNAVDKQKLQDTKQSGDRIKQLQQDYINADKSNGLIPPLPSEVANKRAMIQEELQAEKARWKGLTGKDFDAQPQGTYGGQTPIVDTRVTGAQKQGGAQSAPAGGAKNAPGSVAPAQNQTSAPASQPANFVTPAAQNPAPPAPAATGRGPSTTAPAAVGSPANPLTIDQFKASPDKFVGAIVQHSDGKLYKVLDANGNAAPVVPADAGSGD